MPPPLPPYPCGTSMTASSTTKPRIEIECFLDLICPFSCKMFTTLYKDVLPALQQDDKNKDICIIIQQVIQPWHPQGTMVHEAALAVKRVNPDSYLPYVNAIYRAFEEKGAFKDDVTWNKTRNEIYKELLELIDNEEEQASVQELLKATGKGGNEGNSMTQDIKWAVKYHRTRGVHVTPTVFVNGLEAGAVSSGWTKEQWLEFLEKL